MKKLFTSILACFIMLAIFSIDAHAQEALKQKPSPLGMVTYTFEDTYVKVTYGRPHLRGREAFTETSELAPLGKIWRTGANEATEITVTSDVKMAGETVPAGTYSMFTIPGAKSWTIILNKDVGQWGAYKYDEEQDLLRFEVPVNKSDEMYEPFTIRFDQANGDVSLQMIWANTMISIPFEFL
ncbi:DUF2911 domain-containing protein [Marivirga arenosa]|uniref:DUF2911 domain-containing protein n=1 Tax=Marivirga arenosa TaxID=3059076 RepID=A0AA49GDM5_9BACT|nr:MULTISPECIES: DUF2911 domain-containing protein [unclassified Marivirga]WKK80075.2 DUF2911 domain-containing protein [Marivirga sp. BKB1-2]WKK84876.2 DUF2911 domain-containing protein [Marivirga sp. ABR2-2]